MSDHPAFALFHDGQVLPVRYNSTVDFVSIFMFRTKQEAVAYRVEDSMNDCRHAHERCALFTSYAGGKCWASWACRTCMQVTRWLSPYGDDLDVDPDQFPEGRPPALPLNNEHVIARLLEAWPSDQPIRLQVLHLQQLDRVIQQLGPAAFIP